MHPAGALILMTMLVCGAAGAASAQTQHTYKVLATARTSTMQSEMEQCA